MKCERCNKNLGEYKCSVCNKIVCSDCKTILNGKIVCLDHSQETVKPPKKIGLKALKMGIMGVFIILVGVVLIFFITNYYIIQIELPPDIPLIMDILSLFESFGLHLIVALTIILILLIVAFVILRRRR